jgi:hypothetical protein
MPDTLSTYLSARASMNEFRDKLIAEYHEHQATASEIARVLKSDFGMKTIPKLAARKRLLKRTSTTLEKPPTQIDAKKIGRLQNLLVKAKDELSHTTDPKKSKALTDKIYELEDELRLAKEAG